MPTRLDTAKQTVAKAEKAAEEVATDVRLATRVAEERARLSVDVIVLMAIGANS